jgi:hypothetical protein
MIRKLLQMAGLAVATATSTYAQLGVSTVTQVENLFGSSLGSLPSGPKAYLRDGIAIAVCYDENQIAQAIIYYNSNGEHFTSAQLAKFDRETLPPDTYNWRNKPQPLNPPLLEVTCRQAQTPNTIVLVTDAKYTVPEGISVVRIYETAKGNKLMDNTLAALSGAKQ